MQSSEALNKLKLQKFRARCRSAGVAIVHVSRTDRRGQVLLRYNGRDGKKSLHNGEWVVSRNGRDAEQVEGAVNDFVRLLREEFRLVGHGIEVPGDDTAAD